MAAKRALGVAMEAGVLGKSNDEEVEAAAADVVDAVADALAKEWSEASLLA